MGDPRGTLEAVTIDVLGHRGDGIVNDPDGPLYVPFALPGERVTIARDGDRARIVEILEPSRERTTPICRHFGRCGGCALQMLPLDSTRSLKRGFVIAALAQHGIQTEVTETIGVGVSSRRRAALTAHRTGKRVVLGYHERLSHNLVDIKECPVLVPALFRHVMRLREFLAPLLPERKPVRLTALMTKHGVDVALEGGTTPDAGRLARLAAAAPAAGIARLSMDGEPILSLAEPAIDISGAVLVPPPGAFLQASAEAEAAMTSLVLAHLDGAKRVADLFAGLGTFSLVLARQSRVTAVEENAPALEALTRALRGTKGLKLIATETRDLSGFPLSADELARFDGLVFDPPRAGAREQAEALAASRVPRIVAVSCNPATFARDARILLDGGYVLERVVPIDQFVYSAATEVVGLFTRDVRRAKR